MISVQGLDALTNAKRGDILEFTDKGVYKKEGRKWVKLSSSSSSSKMFRSAKDVLSVIRASVLSLFQPKKDQIEEKDPESESFIKNVIQKESFFTKKTDFIMQVKVNIGETKSWEQVLEENGLNATKRQQLDAFKKEYNKITDKVKAVWNIWQKDSDSLPVRSTYERKRMDFLSEVNELNRRFKKAGGEEMLMQLQNATEDFSKYQKTSDGSTPDANKHGIDNSLVENIRFLNEVYKDFSNY